MQTIIVKSSMKYKFVTLEMIDSKFSS